MNCLRKVFSLAVGLLINMIVNTLQIGIKNHLFKILEYGSNKTLFLLVDHKILQFVSDAFKKILKFSIIIIVKKN